MISSKARNVRRRLMKIDPTRVEYLRLVAGTSGALIDERYIEQTGERIDGLASPFELLPEFRGIRLAGRGAQAKAPAPPRSWRG